MKVWGAALAAVCIAVLIPPSISAQGAPRVIVNDSPVSFPVPPEFRNGVLLVPLGPLVLSFGASFELESGSRAVTVTAASGVVVRLTAGDPDILVGAGRVTLPVAPVLRGTTLLVPAVALLKALGAYVRVVEQEGLIEGVSQVTNVTWRQSSGTLVVKIATTGPVRAEAHVLDTPDRLAVDITHSVNLLRVPKMEIGEPYIVAVRNGQFHARPYVTRIVFDLTRPLPYTVEVDAQGVTVTLDQTLATKRRPPAPPAPPASPRAPSTPEVAPPPVPPAPAPPPASRDRPTPPPNPPDRAEPPAEPIPSPPQGVQPPAPVPGGPADHSLGTLPDLPVERPNAAVVPEPPVLPARPNAALAPEPLAQPPLPEFMDAPGAFHVRDVRYEIQRGAGQLTIRASQPVTFHISEFVYPDRLAIDLPGGVFVARRRDLEIGSGTVRNIVVEQLQVQPNLTRVLLNLRRKATYKATMASDGRSFTLTLGDSGRVGSSFPAVIIDPGHGGGDSGAVGPTGLRESDVTLAIGRMAAQALERQGIRVVLTRADDNTVPLDERPDVAQRNAGMLFISIHANANQIPATAGTETYYKTPASQVLAAMVQNEIVQALGEPDRGIRIADFYVIVNTSMPAVLVETAFISNPAEERLLRDPRVQERVADAIARAVIRFLATRTTTPAP
jgi:N-acetylmuramoyl-L-alanine amidase